MKYSFKMIQIKNIFITINNSQLTITFCGFSKKKLKFLYFERMPCTAKKLNETWKSAFQIHEVVDYGSTG